MLMALHYIFFFIIFPPFSLPPTLFCAGVNAAASLPWPLVAVCVFL